MSRYNDDPLKEFVSLMDANDPFGEAIDDTFEQGLVGIYDPDTNRLLDIRYLTEQEKDTLRQIAGHITHFLIFKR